MKREDYDLAFCAAERHFLAAGHSLPAIEEAMARVSQQLNFEDENDCKNGDSSKAEGDEKDDEPKTEDKSSGSGNPEAATKKKGKTHAEGSKK